MARLACWSCGRQIYTVTSVDSLFDDERRCPRCGAYFNVDRRETERRETIRRLNPVEAPGPPEGSERRVDERRLARRRKNTPEGASRTGGWSTH
jgi:DNA-directed RNA polymerase subunit RPC12/RpoP